MATVLPATCPAEMRDSFAKLSQERVKFPLCPERLTSGFTSAKLALSLDESSRIEELISTQCRPASRDIGESSIDSLLQDFEMTASQRSHPGVPDRPLFSEEELKLRARMRDGLLEVRNVHEPLEQWVRLNGEYVIPEEELPYFAKLVTKNGCKLTDEEVDQSYRTLHSLETLVRIQAEGEEQRARIERFLSGVYKVIGRKIKEYFR